VSPEELTYLDDRLKAIEAALGRLDQAVARACRAGQAQARPPWQWQADDLKNDLEVLRRQQRLLTAALEALVERVQSLEARTPPPAG
jgi:hypothetical protein